MDIAIKLHKLIARFERCVSKFDPAVHKFKFSISYVQDEIQQILQQIDSKYFYAHGTNIKLSSLNAYINDVERMLNISSTSKDIVIDDKEPNPAKTGYFNASVAMENGNILYYNSGHVSIDGIKWSVPNGAYKTKDEVIDDKYFYPANKLKNVVMGDNDNITNITYGLKTDIVITDISGIVDVTVKTFFNGQPITHKDIVPPKISKPNNDIVIE